MNFYSKMKGLRIVLIPHEVTLDERKRPIIKRGKTVEFLNGRFFTDDPEIVTAMLEKRTCGTDFIADHGDVVEFFKAHPEYAKADQSVPMHTGAVSTLAKETGITGDVTPEKISEKTTDEKINEAVLLAVSPLIDRISEMMAKLEKPEVKSVEKSKKVFKCKVCKTEFDSPFKASACSKSHPAS